MKFLTQEDICQGASSRRLGGASGFEWHPLQTLAKVGLLLLLLCSWGCAHKSEDVKAEILKNMNGTSGVVVGHYRPRTLQFDDPSCEEKSLPYMGGGGLLGAFLHALTSEAPCSRMNRALAIRVSLELALQDPTPLVRERFLAELASKLGSGNLRVLPRPVEPEAPDVIGPSLVIDFKTFELKFWRFLADDELTFGSFWKPKIKDPIDKPFHFWFGVRSSVTQVAERRTLSAEACFYRTNERGEGPYSFGELLADEGAKLKQVIEHAADECGKELAAKILAEK